MPYGLFFDIHSLVATAFLSVARVAPVFFILPFLNSNILGGSIRVTVSALVALGVWPHSVAELPTFGTLLFVRLIAQEVAVGLILASLLAFPFWVFHALGNMIDNQRGATLSSTIDPANGVDTSEMANFLNLFSSVFYMQAGGMLRILEMFHHSYLICDPLGTCLPSWLSLLRLVNQVVNEALILASPVFATLLLSEVVLGLFSRFAPQVNAFSVSLTVKSLVAILIIFLFLGKILPSRVQRLEMPASELPTFLQETRQISGE